jgi:lipopolysaccharide transport system permease protein
VAADALTVISVDAGGLRRSLSDLWRYRELCWTFAERDLKVRYKQTALGVSWVLLQPVAVAFAFTGIFGRLGRMPTDGLPHALFYLSALVPWSGFAAGFSSSATSMESNSHLISKVYFPRMILPFAMVLTSLLDFAIGWMLLNAVALSMGHWSFGLVAVTPVLLLVQAATALGLGLPLAALNAEYRDVKHAVPFLVQLGMLATPVIYPASSLPAWAQRWMFLNPLTGVVSGYRAALLGERVPFELIGACSAASIVYLIVGGWFFHRREASLADVL